MASMQSQDVVARSATTTPSPQVRTNAPQVAKLIDESKCIGCKACQVACMNWNDLRDEVGSNIGVYDNPSDLTPSSWTVMKFFEVEPSEGSLEWLIRKDGCMHCDDPGCLKACPSPGAIVQYANGIVDFVHENCIGCGYCVKGCPFNIPRVSQVDSKAYKCTLCSDRVAVGRTPRTLIWSLGRVQLFRYTPTLPPAQHQPTPLLLVYALISIGHWRITHKTGARRSILGAAIGINFVLFVTLFRSALYDSPTSAYALVVLLIVAGLISKCFSRNAARFSASP